MSSRTRIASLIASFIMVLSTAQAALASTSSKEDASPRPASEGVVNINTATANQLALLPGVGPSRAEAIIQARERRPFANVNELVRVRGIGRAMLQRIRPYATVSGETTLQRSVPMRSGEP